MRFRRVVWLVAMCVMLTAVLRATPPPNDPRESSDGSEVAPATQPAVDYFAITFDEFALTEAANQKIDPKNLDNSLVSAAIMHETNRVRVAEGRTLLQHLPELDEACRLHAKDMAQHRYLAHEQLPGGEHPTPAHRARAVGLKPILLAENLAIAFGIQYDGGREAFPLSQWGRRGLSYKPDGPPIPLHTYQSFAKALVKSWMNSPNHRQNILIGDAVYMGSACVLQVPGDDETTNAFHRFYCGQLFYTPSRMDRKRE